MRNIISLTLVLVMLMMLVACGGGETEKESSATEATAAVETNPTEGSSGTGQTTPEDTQTSEEELERMLDEQKDSLLDAIGSVTDISVFSVKEGDIYINNNSGSKEYTLKANHGAAAISSIVVGGHEFADGTYLGVSRFIEAGWSCTNLDHEVSSKFAAMMPCQDPDGKNVIIRGFNQTDGTIAFQDCIVTGVDVKYDGLKFTATSAADMQINGSAVTRVDSLTKVIEKVGCPSEIYIEACFSNGAYSFSRVTATYYNDGASLLFEYRIEDGKSSLQGITYDFS